MGWNNYLYHNTYHKVNENDYTLMRRQAPMMYQRHPVHNYLNQALEEHENSSHKMNPLQSLGLDKTSLTVYSNPEKTGFLQN